MLYELVIEKTTTVSSTKLVMKFSLELRYHIYVYFIQSKKKGSRILGIKFCGRVDMARTMYTDHWENRQDKNTKAAKRNQ